MQHGSCDTSPEQIKIVLGSVLVLCQFSNRLAEASSSYSLQTEFQDGDHSVFQYGTNIENNLAWLLSYHPVQTSFQCVFTEKGVGIGQNDLDIQKNTSATSLIFGQ